MAIYKANSKNDGAEWWIAGNVSDLTLSHNPAFKVGDFCEIKPSDAPNAYKVYVYTGQNSVAPFGWELWGVKGGGGSPNTDLWIKAGEFTYAKWQPAGEGVDTKMADLVDVPANYIISGLAIQRKQRFTDPNQVIGEARLEFYSSEQPSSPLDTGFSNDLYSENAPQHRYIAFCRGNFSWQSAYKLQAQLRVSGDGASIDLLTTGIIDVWYRLEKLPA